MDIIRNIPNKYVYVACLVLSFLLFFAGGSAFNQSPFYGAVFIILAIFMFFVSVYIGRKYRMIE